MRTKDKSDVRTWKLRGPRRCWDLTMRGESTAAKHSAAETARILGHPLFWDNGRKRKRKNLQVVEWGRVKSRASRG